MTMPTSPPLRSVARPVSNLGNTCYMNAVLQALAHAPELCLAMDCNPHHLTCPIAAENALKRSLCAPTDEPDAVPPTAPLPQSSATSVAAAAAVSSVLQTTGAAATPHPQRTRQSARRTANGTGPHGTTTTPPTVGGRKSPRTNTGDADSTHSSNGGTTDDEFCTLCAIEEHIRQVHDASQRDRPLAPTTFVHGFMDHVAPWFALGVQEDSHEFLRLLIDAMQKSCRRARIQDNPQDDSRDELATTAPNNTMGDEQDIEYPFSLFRGTVESNVVCGSCQATSLTLDPIEDVGLEVTIPPDKAAHSTVGAGSGTGSASRGTSAASRNTSPVPATSALTDVATAFSRFAQTEALDMGYKCDSCGKVGRATKQSRLASIPPILTLHLKRFRYGDRAGTAAPATSRRSCRSEVSQLLGNNDYLGGKSGSAKIEGHIKFDLIFDLKPYLTDELKQKHKSMFCRLFAVIVHAGKNSHSGHYIAFVRDVSQNEWWKMDDSRVTSVTTAEVMQAEAYMLLYRVVQHPVTVQLEELHKKQQLANRNAAGGPSSGVSASGPVLDSTQGSRKRAHDALDFDEDWLLQGNFPPHLVDLVQKVMEMMADDIQVTERFRKTIDDEATNAKGPMTKLSEVDVVGGTSKYTKMICELFYRLKNYPNSAAPWLASIINGHDGAGATKTVATTSARTDMSDNRVALEEPDDSSGLH